MKQLSTLVVAVAALGGSGAALAQTKSPGLPIAAPSLPAALPSKPVSLAGSLIYTYSFLDVRDDAFTPKVIAQIDHALAEKLTANNVQFKELSFKDSPLGQGFSMVTGYGNNSAIVPVREVIADNGVDEASSGAKYRMIIFPSDFKSQGSWRYYEIRWTVVEISSGHVVWTYAYRGQHMVLMKNSENAQNRATKIIDGVFNDMREHGLI